LSKIIRGAKINWQPIQIKINPPFYCDIAPEKASETSDVISVVEEGSEAPAIDVAEYIAQAEAEAQSIITEARKTAAEAQERAQQIISEAQKTAVQLKDEAVNEGQAEGHAEGHALGHLQGVEQGYRESAGLLEQAAQIVDYAKIERQDIIERCEREVLELALSVAAKVIHTEVTINPDVILAVVKDAIQKAKDQEQVIIRVNPADFETITSEKQTLQAILRRETGMEIRGDIGVEVGGCVIETDYGAIDARIDTQLEGIKNALLGVVKHG
jgi:flagellar assembly protein FliH